MNFNKSKILNNAFDVINYLIMLLIIFLTIYPFWLCLVGSFNEGMDYIKGGVNFWPRKFTLANYKVVFMEKTLLGSFQVTILRTIIGTTTHIIFTSIFAYAYSRKILKGKKFYMIILLITMYFQGGLIPKYLLYSDLHLINNFLVYIFPGLLSVWDVVIMQSFFKGIPDSLTESAMIDGANEYMIYWKIIMPLSLPVLATITLFAGVGHWNSFFDSMVFTSSKKLQTVQVYLMNIIRNQQQAAKMAQEAGLDDDQLIVSQTIQLATMITVTLPIIFIYPFLQKYFAKGLLIGSIKG